MSFIGKLHPANIPIFKKFADKRVKKVKSPVVDSPNGGFKERLKLTLSKLSGAFMLPISVMAIAGLFLGIGAAIESQSQASLNALLEEWKKTHTGAEPSFEFLDANLWRTVLFGKFIQSLGGPIFDAMPILFAAAFVVAFTNEAGVGVFASIVAFLVFTSIQSVFILPVKDSADQVIGYNILFTQGGRTPESMKQVVGPILGITALQTSIFGGILVGLIVSYMYNRFHKIQLPAAIAFFGGKRFVSLISIVAMIPLAFLFLIFWPWIGRLFDLFGQASGRLPAGVDSLIFGYIERSLIPFGLHHVFYAPLWWSGAGGNARSNLTEWLAAGNKIEAGSAGANLTQIINANPDRWVGDSYMSVSVSSLPFNEISFTNKGDPTVHTLRVYEFFANELHLRLGRFLQGKYPFMQFALPAAALAMVLAAPKENRKIAFGSVFPSALTSFITGVTEPIEFTFLFLAPLLFWGFHAIMAAFSFLLMNVLGAHIAMTFSGGFIDLIIYGAIPFLKGTNFYWWVVIGVGYAPIYFFVFYFWIKKANLPTPGRGQSIKLFTKADYRDRKNKKSKDEKAVTDPAEVPSDVVAFVEGFGGWENIANLNNCASRLRYDIKDRSKVNEEQLKAAGGIGVRWIGEKHVQVIIGPKAEQLNSKINSFRNKPLHAGETVYQAPVASAPAAGAPAQVSNLDNLPKDVAEFIDGFGGWENISTVELAPYCRLLVGRSDEKGKNDEQYYIKDLKKIDQAKLKETSGVEVKWVDDKHVQVVIGPKPKQENSKK